MIVRVHRNGPPSGTAVFFQDNAPDFGQALLCVSVVTHDVFMLLCTVNAFLTAGARAWCATRISCYGTSCMHWMIRADDAALFVGVKSLHNMTVFFYALLISKLYLHVRPASSNS